MLDIFWFNVEEEIQRIREIRILECIFRLRPTHPVWEGPEAILCTNTVRHKFVRGATASLKSSVIIVLCRLDLTVGLQ